MAAIDYIATGLNAESIAIHLGGLANAKEFDHVPLLILEKIHHDSVRPASDFKVNHKHNQFAASMRLSNMPVNKHKHAMNKISSCEIKTWIDDKKIGQTLPKRHADEATDL